MASIRKRGSNSYLIVVSRGYDYECGEKMLYRNWLTVEQY